jgi:ABC-type Fe3+-siderophore transport system permease subunit
LYARVKSQREGLLLCAASAGVALAAAATGLIQTGRSPAAITTSAIFGLIAAGILAYLLTRPGRSPAI